MPTNRGNRSRHRYTGGAPKTYWRGSIGRDARYALSVLALQDAIAERIEQHEAEQRLIARLILAERTRRLEDKEPASRGQERAEMQIVNLTPHVLRLYAEDGETVLDEIPSHGVARVTSAPPTLGDWELPVPVATPTVYGEVEGLPEPQLGVVYVTSMLVAAAVRRPDVISPGTGPNDGCIRDGEGRISGVTRLIAHV